MMINPDSYIKMIEDKSYNNLLKERDLLVRKIRRFEKDKDRYGEEWIMLPSPEIRYQMNLQYLGKLCELISEVYNRKYVWDGVGEVESDYRNLLENIEKIHSTQLGIQRIKENLSLDVDDIVKWCKDKIQQSNASRKRKGKNWYIEVDGCEITINSTSLTIITAHKKKVFNRRGLDDGK